MMTCGVAQEVGVIGGEERLAAKGGDAGSTAVAETCGGLDDKTLLGGEPGFSEAIAEARTEVHILPPCRLEGGVEAAQSPPYGAAHHPRGGGRLGNGDGSLRW